MSDKLVTLIPVNPSSKVPKELKLPKAQADELLKRENGGGWKLKNENGSNTGDQTDKGATSESKAG